jgi:hypothetical protein
MSSILAPFNTPILIFYLYKTLTQPTSSNSGFFGASIGINGAPIFSPEQKLVPWSRRLYGAFLTPKNWHPIFAPKGYAKDTHWRPSQLLGSYQ